MTKQNHPIIPPSYLLKLWRDQHCGCNREFNELLIEAAQWGADQELEECVEWLHVPNNRSDRGDGWLMPGRLRAARRPKPPSLAGAATYELDEAVMRGDCISTTDAMPHLRAALKRLAELENQPQS
jgi:hypothetical protein